MLFNSYPFLFGFLPLALAGFALFGRLGPAAAGAWLAAMSVLFYIGNGVASTALLLASAAVNHRAGQALAARAAAGRPGGWRLAVAVAGNLALLGWFKYAGFLAGIIGLAPGTAAEAVRTALPIGISFYSFTQIAWLVDAASGRAGRTGWLQYLLFVTWFPHLVAGPLLHHSATVPQFHDPSNSRLRADAIAVGATVFLIGLFKKVALANSLAGPADALFAADSTLAGSAAAAWVGALAYTLQIYFDFSGYSDMAIGLSRMFNIRLPANFNSPYQATSIIDFWRRWHMTLSAFLRDYVYIPLGGSRHGRPRQLANLLATMLLAGLWHGAGWTFVLWGAWHGVSLVVNHLWRVWRKLPIPAFAGWALTMLAVVLGWVLFRAPDFATAARVYADMAGLHRLGPVPDIATLLLLAGIGAIALLAPNTRQLMAGETLVIPRPNPATALLRLRWQPNLWWASACLALCVVALMRMTRISPFLYYPVLTMAYRRFNRALLTGLAFLLASLAGLAAWLEPVRGNLTRIGFYSENAYGWRGTEHVFVPPLAQPGRLDGHYDIVVLGDSFSLPTSPDRQTGWGGFWTDRVAAGTGARIGVFNIQALTPEALLAAPVMRRDPPHLFILESVERQLHASFDRPGPCDIAPANPVNPLQPAATPPPPATIQRPRGPDLDPARGEYLLAFTFANAMRAAGWDTTNVRRLPLTRPDLFTSRAPADLLVTAEDYDRAHWPDAAWTRIACRLRTIQAAITANRRTRFLLLLAPDKSSAYRDLLVPADRPIDAIARLAALTDIPRIAADDALHAAITAGEPDVYLPDDTHWGDHGTAAVAAAALRAITARPRPIDTAQASLPL